MALHDWLSPPSATATPATLATGSPSEPPSVATVATVAVASPAEIDFEPGWRRRAAVQQWERDWRPVWERWRDHLARNPGLPCPNRAVSLRRIGELVIGWNCITGDCRTVADVTGWLVDEDFADRELMTPGALALYVGTVLCLK